MAAGKKKKRGKRRGDKDGIDGEVRRRRPRGHAYAKSTSGPFPTPPREGSDGLFITRWTAATWTACLLIGARQLGWGGWGGARVVMVAGEGQAEVSPLRFKMNAKEGSGSGIMPLLDESAAA